MPVLFDTCMNRMMMEFTCQSHIGEASCSWSIPLRVGVLERKTIRLANALAASNQPVVLAYLNPPESPSHVHSAVTVLNLNRHGVSPQALRRLGAVLEARNVGRLIAMKLYPALYAVLVL